MTAASIRHTHTPTHKRADYPVTKDMSIPQSIAPVQRNSPEYRPTYRTSVIRRLYSTHVQRVTAVDSVGSRAASFKRPLLSVDVSMRVCVPATSML